MKWTEKEKELETSNKLQTPNLGISDVISDTNKTCQNCKFYIENKNRCTHEYWCWCVKRDDDGYVTSYVYHDFR